MTNLPITDLYTDGACSGNPGPGGWGVVVCYPDGSVHELGGVEPQTTNNRMEMQAAIAALQFLADSGQITPVTLYTDSEYLKNGITQWIKGWKQKGWKTAAGKPVLNQDLWQQLDQLNQQYKQIQWKYVRGHSGDRYNERCDEIARAFSLGQTPCLQPSGDQPLAAEVSKAVSQEASRTIAIGTQGALKSATLSSNFGAALESLEYSETTDPLTQKTIPSRGIISDYPISDSAMNEPNADTQDNLPREVRVEQLRHLIDTLHIADEVASKRYLVTSSELADLMDINASAVTSRGDHWVWRNWVVSRVRREGNQILWQLERVD